MAPQGPTWNPRRGSLNGPLGRHLVWWGSLLKRVQTHTMTIYTKAKINHKMPPQLALK